MYVSAEAYDTLQQNVKFEELPKKPFKRKPSLAQTLPFHFSFLYPEGICVIAGVQQLCIYMRIRLKRVKEARSNLGENKYNLGTM